MFTFKRIPNIICNIVFLLKKLWSFKKSLIIVSFFQIPILTILPLINILIPKIIVEQLSKGIQLYNLLLFIIILSLFILIIKGIQQLLDGIITYQKNNFVSFLLTLHDYKTLDTDYEVLESQLGQQRRQKALSSIYEAGTNILPLYISFIVNLLGFIIYSSIIIQLNLSLFIILLFTNCTNIFMLFRINEYEYKNKDKLTSLERKIAYIETQSSSIESGKEIRIYNMSNMFKTMHKNLLEDKINLIKSIQLKQYKFDIISNIITMLCSIVCYGYLAYSVIYNNMSISSFILFFGIILGFSNWINNILSDFNKIDKISLQIQDIVEYLNMSNKMLNKDGIAVPQSISEIKFEHVFYNHVGNKNSTIKDINLTINSGEKIAIVGTNGSGKTTLVKLLCGLYTPTSGKILINGNSINKYNRDSYYKLFSAVFQDIHLIPASIEKNIAMCIEKEINYKKINTCIELSSLTTKISNLKYGLKTMLIKSIYKDAIDLSGGELQKLMLARAIYKEGLILILDEPTAALDPIAESEIYEKYNDITKNCISIFISHRFASTRFCDKIILLQDGKIIEQGTHEELIKLNKEYAKMFFIQSRYYKSVESKEQFYDNDI